MTDTALPPISCEGVSHRYGRVQALSEVSLRVEPGAVYALLGRNGAGKSTLVRGLLGLQKPRSGQLRLWGQEAWTHRATCLARVGAVPEEPDAPPTMTAAALEAFCGSLYPQWSGAAVRERLQRGSIPLDIPFGRLSRGQKAQVGLALALGHAPDLLILDDPTLGLDAVARRDFYGELVEELAARGTTVLVTTHDLVGIEGIATHVGILREGRLVVDGALEDLKARYRLLRTPGTSLEAADLEVLAPLQIEARPWGTETLVSRFEAAHVEALRHRHPELETESLSLEGLFLALAGPEAQS